MKKALITGVYGQDGSFLSELLLEKGYEVYGADVRIMDNPPEYFVKLFANPYFYTQTVDLTDTQSVLNLVTEVRPDEIYNFAAQSNVKVSFDKPELTSDIDAIGVLRILEAIRRAGLTETCRFFQASTSAMFGNATEVPENENTPLHPNDPYAISKVYGYWMTRLYRNAYHMHVCNGILFNHESERRPEIFVTSKIALAAARIAHGLQEKLSLGNLNALRDWGYAKDYVECMWLMLQHEKADDYVIATGEQHSVRDFCTLAFKEAGIDLEWRGEGLDEKGIDKKTGKTVVEVDPNFFRPTEANQMYGDPSKAKNVLGWNPRKTTFEQLVQNMVRKHLKDVRKQAAESGRLSEELPVRLDLAGTWIDQPMVSKYAPGWAITISLEPTFEIKPRFGLGSTIRDTIKKIWPKQVPDMDSEMLARLIFCFANNPENNDGMLSGAQDAIGICVPGLARHYYNNRFWPERIESSDDEDILTWLENHLCMVPMFPRRLECDLMAGKSITKKGVETLAKAAEDCWMYIMQRDLDGFASSFLASFNAQKALFPGMIQSGVQEYIDKYSKRPGVLAWKISGSGGGGYLVLVCHSRADFPSGAVNLHIRREKL